MAITVTHTKVSLIPDGDDDTLIRPSDWNAEHELTGTIPVANGGTGASTLTGYVKGNGTSAMTASATIPSTAITGLGTMSTQNSNNISVTGGTVPINQLPAAVLGALSYQGTWDAATNTPTLTSSVGTKGYYYVVNVAGSTNLNGITDWKVGDWAVYNGTAWQKIDNTDAVTSVNGYTGTVVLTNTDISGFGTMSTQNANAVAVTGGTINGTTIGATTASTGAFTTVTASTSLTTPTVQATNSGGLSLKNSAGTTQISMGGGGGDNVSINVSTNLNGSNAQIDISPTGTGHVHMKPTGTGSIEIAPTNVGTMDNMTIGATTAAAGSFTNLSVTGTTSFDGSQGTAGQVLTSAGTGNTPTWTNAATGTVTSVAASAGTGISVSGSPITSSGTLTITNTAPDQTVSIASGTGISATGTYPNFTVTNTAPDQTVAFTNGTGISVTGTYPNFTVTNTSPSSGGTVTSVTGTAPVVSSGGTTPAISMAAATTSVNGYLTSTDWTTFNGKQTALVSGTNIKTINGSSVLGSGDLTVTGTPAGSTTQVQYNNAGAFGASASFTYASSTLTAPIVSASNGLVVNSATVATSYSIPSGSNAMSAGPVTVASGQTVTVPSGSRWVVL